MVISLSFIMILNMTGCIDGLPRDAVPAATLQMCSSLQASSAQQKKRLSVHFNNSYDSKMF